MPFELREHTADVAVAATGATLGGTFAAVADGLAAAHVETVPAADDPDGGDRFDLAVVAESPESLLFEYCDRLVYERDVRGVLPVDNRAEVHRPEAAGATDDDPGGAGEAAEGGARWCCSASARGVALTALAAREVKAVTYSEMAIEETADGWSAYVVFDV